MTETDLDKLDFEQALAELETLVEKMEQGDLTLDQSLTHFERGVKLTRSCQQALKNAQLKVDQLTKPDESDAEPFSSQSD